MRRFQGKIPIGNIARKERRKRAEALLQKAENEPQNTAAHARAAGALVRLRRFDQAEAMLDRALLDEPKRAGLLIKKAVILAKGGRRGDAIALLRVALQSNPRMRERAHAHAILAGLLMEAGSIEEAEQELSHVKQSDGDLEFNKYHARLALHRGEWEKAASLLQSLTDAKPGAPKGVHFLQAGIQLEKFGNAERAWESYLRAIGPELVGDPKIRAFYEASAMRRIRTNSLLAEPGYAEFNDFSKVAQLEDFLAKRIAGREPTSLLRMADGEGRVLAGKDPTIDGATFSSTRQEPLAPEELAEFQAAFHQSIEEADILGLPREDMLRNRDNRSVIAALSNALVEQIAAGAVLVVDQRCHWHMQQAGSYPRLLRGLDFVGVVAGRDVTEHLREAFGVRNIAWMPLPVQARRGELQDKPHYPDRYREVVTTLHVPYQGAVFLVAGGQIGKVYCGEIRRRGGIALDIGAVADLWAGLRGTRPYLMSRPDLAAQ
jgi:Tfp pilus assembly protein PilF